jgi:hypothetical protein
MNRLANLFSSKKSAKTRKPADRFRPGLENLEGRDLMAASLVGGNLVIQGTAGNDSATVTTTNRLGLSLVKVTENGTNSYFFRGAITGSIYFYGYAGNDYFNNCVGSLRAIAYGGAGNDTLWGDAGNDYLYGQDGNDTLYGYTGNDVLCGGAGNDKLYGGSGTDYLYGEDGNDFLDAGSAYEYTNGGNGSDFNAYVTAVNGATYTDVRQGNSPTCWLVSSISSVAHTGVNLASRISYLGSNTYRVGMYNTSGVYTNVYVSFNGDTNSADAVPATEGESWVLLTQRAYLQSRGISITNPPGGWADGPLFALTGRSASSYYNAVGSSMGSADLTRIQNALAANRNVIADTRDSASDLSTNMLVNWHQYTVVRVEVSYIQISWFRLPIYNVVLRNPWGYDGGATTSGDPTDGEVRVSWSDFARSMDAYIIA